MQQQPPSTHERYQRLLAAIHANRCLWIAEAAELPLVLPDESGVELIAVWPSEEEAWTALSAQPDLSAFRPVPRPLDRWLTLSTPHLIEDQVLVGAFPDENLACLRVPAADFARDISAAPQLQGSDLSRLRRKVAARRRDGGA